MAIGPYFSSLLQYRVNNKMATNIVVSGEPGIGKSYMATDLARILEGLTDGGHDRFKIDQVVFTYSEFMDLVIRLPAGKTIVFDEPSYAMGKREWYKDLNKALVQTVESFRFKVHPLFIPIVNKSLLDKTIRSYLIQYQVNILHRGHGMVYKVKPSQFDEKVFYEQLTELFYRLFDQDQCPQESCLGCKSLDDCMVFRAQYERKKASIQESRYQQASDLAEKTEGKMLAINQLEALAMTLKDKWFIDGRIDIHKLRVALQDAQGIQVSMNKGYHLKSSLLVHFPELSEQ
jgi:hypothetical protein